MQNDRLRVGRTVLDCGSHGLYCRAIETMLKGDLSPMAASALGEVMTCALMMVSNIKVGSNTSTASRAARVTW